MIAELILSFLIRSSSGSHASAAVVPLPEDLEVGKYCVVNLRPEPCSLLFDFRTSFHYVGQVKNVDETTIVLTNPRFRMQTNPPLYTKFLPHLCYLFKSTGTVPQKLKGDLSVARTDVGSFDVITREWAETYWEHPMQRMPVPAEPVRPALAEPALEKTRQ